MTLGIMQPYFFPYIGYFQLLHAVDRFVVYDDVNYIKRGWVNRNRILVGGQDNLFTIPVLNASQNNLICETEISADQKWREKLLKTIRYAYSDASQFAPVYSMVESVVNHRCLTISELAIQSLMAVKEYLKLETEIIPSSKVYSNHKLKGMDRILDICKKECATRYYNPIGGMELYDRPTFEQAGVELKFISPAELSYTQRKNQFVANLSIIDVLMFNPPSEVIVLLAKYRLI